MQKVLFEKIKNIEQLAKGQKWQRLVHRPYRYLSGMFFRHFVYANSKKGKIVEVPTFFGAKIQLLLPAGMDIYLLGGKTHSSEIRLTKFLINKLQKGNTFVDIGTHFGFYSLLAAHLVEKEGKVIGIEASHSIFELYQQNIALYSNIQGFHLAATDKASSLSFYEFPILYSEYNTVNPAQFQAAKWLQKNPPKEIIVAGKNVDLLMTELNLIPDFIKIDVEGAEFAAIKGAEEMLIEHHPTIALEYLIDSRENAPHQQAAQFLQKLNYKAHIIDNEGELEYTTNIEAAILQQGLDSDNIIFLKKL